MKIKLGCNMVRVPNKIRLKFRKQTKDSNSKLGIQLLVMQLEVE